MKYSTSNSDNPLTYSGPNDTCKGFPSGKLGNMANRQFLNKTGIFIPGNRIVF